MPLSTDAQSKVLLKVIQVIEDVVVIDNVSSSTLIGVLDSLDRVEVIMVLEDELGVRIPDDFFTDAEDTVGKAANRLAARSQCCGQPVTVAPHACTHCCNLCEIVDMVD